MTDYMIYADGKLMGTVGVSTFPASRAWSAALRVARSLYPNKRIYIEESKR